MGLDYSDKTVLVADNSPVMARLIRKNLMVMGFQVENVTLTNDGHQAFLLAGLKRFDLITSGFHMQLKDGLEFLKSIRGNGGETAKDVLFLTISSERKDYIQDQIREAGANGILTKPFDMDEFNKTIESVFNNGSNGFLSLEQATDVKTKEAMLKSESNNTYIDPKIILPFVESALEGLGQYMVAAKPRDPVENHDLPGEFSSSIDLMDMGSGIQLIIILVFPKKTACQIYENIFGEVDVNEVCGVVQELGNIIGGIVKPRIASYSAEIRRLVYPKEAAMREGPLNFELGLPAAHMGDDHTPNLNQPDCPKFTVPFSIDEETITLQVLFQQY